MCISCFPWTWTQYDDPLDNMPEQSVWTHDGQSWSLQRVVRISCGGYLVFSSHPCTSSERKVSSELDGSSL